MPQVRREKRVQVPVEFEDGLVINLVIDKNRATSAWANALGESEGAVEAADHLADIIIGWDVEGENGIALPISGQAIADNFDVDDLARLTEEMTMNLTPSRAEKNSSSQPSSERPSVQASEPPSTFQNGSETSELQPASASPSTK
jgi:hypothetical protein